ncbi:Uncharacterised protein [Mycobacteroides abscessus subsp. bolletii]|uniref:Uncharacterized protein n=1 Tax=Mycobacteroides abscessus subsp. bolletii TaxID=319705 RepID=A0A9Q7WI55_9MYCO|nr:hypothetical protein [Mycobacteroides abscessus]SHU30786.1 Uncharacterised protein [Mycobacteroides abscessus subsp. bolletii]SHV29048.1 Uncharacterised protein [Mycobacteroides abscessus subsp. bolletii]SHX16292.1 Uncharacterised protein [Mycobacteroides abscessus subsp. bolletii]SKL43298.1 Uncharacterised protein [Mycobacteroides abscessus subsp. bolletii]SKM69691.1 Uncharacterised protein [Mycobacteroides abscessus subsp. bolletii]
MEVKDEYPADELASREEHLQVLRGLVRKRRACVAAADLAELELGRELGQHCQKFGVSMDELADELELRTSAMVGFRDMSQGKFTALSPDGTVPTVTYGHVSELTEKYGPVSRVIGHVGSDVVLYESDLGLKPFYRDGDRYGKYIFCEHMLLRFGDDAWVQVEGMQFGYGGTGPSNAYRVLLGVGLPEEIAELVFARNSINLIIGDDGDIVEKEFDDYPPSLPKLADDGSLVVIIHGSRLGESNRELLRWWIDYLDSEDVRVPWTDGPRRISVYHSRSDAREDGFDSYDGIPQLIIEQGDLQIWLIEFVEDDSSVWIPRQFRRYLEILGALPEDIIAGDDASRFHRWKMSHGHRRPRIVPLGAGKVSRVPKLRDV